MCRNLEKLESRMLFASTDFAVIGDFGQAGANELAVANLVKSWNPDLIVTVGDNSYPTASAAVIDTNIGQYYHDYIYNYQGNYGAGSPTRRFYPALGNHDWGNVGPPNGNADDYLDYFDLPGNERYYEFTSGPVHFFVIDSDLNEPDGTTASSVQGQWLKSRLAVATEPHKLVFFHHPAYTSGTRGSNLYMRCPFAKWGATAVLMGHDHHYERLSEQGIPYFIDGVGGASVTTPGTTIVGSQFIHSGQYGALRVTADDTTIQFRHYNTSSTLIDSYLIDLNTSRRLVRAGDAWKYLDNGSNHGTTWRNAGFDDGDWASGEGQLGYGDGDESTTVSYGSDAGAKYVTTYFRKSFNVTNPAGITSLNLSMLRDDGAVVYLNGTEIFRTNMPGGSISYTTLASSAPSAANEGNYYSTTVSPSLLVAGSNVLAVEIHQISATSSDISFDLALNATGDFTIPTVVSSVFHYDTPPMSLSYTFSESVAASISAGDLVLENLSTSTTIASGNIDLNWLSGTNTAVFTFGSLPGGILPDGRYRATLSGITDAAGNVLSGNGVTEFHFMRGDANHSGSVDIYDLRILASHWQMPSGSSHDFGDFDFDGIVNEGDLTILASRWQQTLAPAAPADSLVPARAAARRPVRPVSVVG